MGFPQEFLQLYRKRVQAVGKLVKSSAGKLVSTT